MTVWVIEQGEYENRFVYGVATSPEAAVEFLKRLYGPPYIVEWGALKADDSEPLEYSVSAQFRSVPGKACAHVAVYSFSPFELEGSAPENTPEPSAVKREESQCPPKIPTS